MASLYDDDMEVCPKCQGRLIDKHGKFGDFIGCSNFPKCKYSRRRWVEPTDIGYGEEGDPNIYNDDELSDCIFESYMNGSD